MNTLYRKVLFNERLPNDNNYHDTDRGKIYCWKGLLCNQSGVLKFTPDWWLEEVNIPTDEDMNKVAIEKTSTRGEYLNYLDGFKDAVELLTVGKNNIDINIKLSFTKHNEQRNNLQR